MASNDDEFEVFLTQRKGGLRGYRVALSQQSTCYRSGGMVSYGGKYMLLTTNDVMGHPGDKYHVIKWDITQYNQKHEEVKGWKRKFGVLDTATGSKSKNSDGPAFLIPNDPIPLPVTKLLPDKEPLPDKKPEEFIGSGKIIVEGETLDYALIEMAGPRCTQISSLIALGDENRIVVHRNKLMQVEAVTPSGGYVRGTRRSKFWTVRLPGSNEDLRAYAAMFDGPLGPGYAGSWVLDAETKKLLGHIITVGFFKGSEVALIVPAKDVFENACKTLDPSYEVDQGRSVWRKLIECG